MNQFQKRPVIIEAMQFRGIKLDDVDYELAFDEWLMAHQGERVVTYSGQELIIPTLEGDHIANVGDWIIKGVAGELYPCKPEIFAKTYRPIADGLVTAELPEGQPPEITDIDVVSFAARVSQVAAAELYGLLTTGEPIAIDGWFVAAPGELTAEALSETIETMAAYASKTACRGEQLYRSQGGRDWETEPVARRMAFDLFAVTMASVGAKLLATQRAAEQALELATRPDPGGLKREDSIFEEAPGLGDLRPEAVESHRQQAEAKRRQAAKDRAKFNGADPKAFDHDGDGRPGGSKPAKAKRRPPTKPAAQMTVGEPPAKRPVNRGGRGRKKTK